MAICIYSYQIIHHKDMKYKKINKIKKILSLVEKINK